MLSLLDFNKPQECCVYLSWTSSRSVYIRSSQKAFNCFQKFKLCSLAKPRRAEIVWQLFLNDSSSFSFNQYVDSLRLQSCLLCLINCEWDNVRNPLFFLARSHVVYWFCFVFPASFLVSTPCLLTCEFTAVLPSCTALIIPAFSINIIQITAMVQTSHQSTHIQWRPQPQTNKVRFNTGNINLHFNIFKLKTIYWQTISYNKICSYL